MNPERLDKDRTQMANERTLLAFVRTALSILIFGVAVHKFYSENPISNEIFIVSVISGVFLLLYGLFKFFFFMRKLN